MIKENIPEQESDIEPRQTDEIAQSLNIIFNSATLYGGDHPSTRKNASNFATILQKVFHHTSSVTLLRIGDSLYIEKQCVDHRMNSPRIINTLQRVGIESITFENGVVGDDIKGFIKVVSDIQNFPSAEAMKNEFANIGVSNVRLNYVFFKKVTEDDTVVNKEDLMAESLHDATDDETSQRRIFDQIGRLISLKDLFESPELIASNILETTETGQEEGTAIVNRIREINKQIQNREDSDNEISIDEMMESVLKLSSEVKQGLAVQKEMGKIFKEENLIINEIDQLTYQTVIQLIREEYKKGDISIKRLSQIIRRILPDIRDLKKLLPQLKEALLADGMSVPDFLELTNELNKELRSDGLIEALEEGAESMGLSVDEIVEAIKSDPNEATKIIVLASEIKQTTGTDQYNISEVLTDYIESVSSEMALEYHDKTKEEGARELEHIITHIENQLTTKLKSHGISDSVVEEVEKQLERRFPKTFDKLKADWIVSYISEGKDLSNSNIIRIINTFIEHKSDLDKIKKPIESALKEKGFTQDEIEEIFGIIVEKIKPKQRSAPLPKFLLNSTKTKFFLEHKIKECCRYDNWFSTIIITISSAIREGIWQPVTDKLIHEVMPEICNNLKGLLRDEDLIGSLRLRNLKNIFIILPMTDSIGANVVKRRIKNKFNGSTFLFDDLDVTLNLIISVSTFDREKTAHYQRYVKYVKKQYNAEKEKAESSL